MSTTYDELGVKPVINVVGTLTHLGGAIMPREVVKAMADAAEHCVRIGYKSTLPCQQFF